MPSTPGQLTTSAIASLVLGALILTVTAAAAAPAAPAEVIFRTDTLGGVGALAFHPTRPEIVLANDAYTTRIISSADGKSLRTLPAPNMVFNTMGFDPTGITLAGGSHGMIYFWDPRTGNNSNQIKANFGDVRALAYSPDGVWLAASCSDGFLHLFDARTFEHRYSLPLDGARIFSLAFAPDSKHLAAPSGLRVYLWKVGQREVPTILAGHRAAVTSLSFALNGKRLVSGDLSGTIAVWDTETAKPVKTHRDHEGPILKIAADRGGYLIAVAGKDRSITLREGGAGDVVQRITGLYREPLTMDISPDGQRLAAGFRLPGNAFQLWRLDRANLVKTQPDAPPRAAGADILSEQDDAVLSAMNLARTDPAALAETLATWRPRFEGKILVGADGSRATTAEGVAALDDAIKFLKSRTPLPAFAVSKGLCLAAGNSGESLQDRLSAQGRYHAEVFELVVATMPEALATVAQLIIDDGQPDRPRRQTLFDATFKVVGLHGGRSGSGGTLRLIFADAFIEEKPAP